MKVDYTKRIDSNNLRDLRIALNERRDNILIDSLSSRHISIIEKIKTNPDSIWDIEDYRLLKEIAANTRKLWNKQELNIYFFGGIDLRAEKVINIASEWSQYCNIRFNQVNNIKDSDIRISFTGAGSWSYIGTDAQCVQKNEPTVNFGWLNIGLPENEYKRVVLHEFGHILGLLHEHQNPSIKIDWDKPNVYWYCKFHFGWSQQTTDINIIQEFEKRETKYSSVDKDSIMAYWIPSDFTKDGTIFPLNYELSQMDKEYIGQIYI